MSLVQTKHLLPGVPELGGHETVEDEVGGAVDEDDDLKNLSERIVTRLKELNPKYRREHPQYSLNNKS